MSSLKMLPISLLLLVIVPLSNSLRCFSNICPGNLNVCIQICPTASKACHAVRQFREDGVNKTFDLGCTLSPNCNNTECHFKLFGEHIPNLLYCCCTEDFCNRVAGETDHIDPIYGISPSLPSVPVPNSDQLICESYNCSRNHDSCYHGYEVCSTTTPGANSNIEDHSCQSVYEINPKTRKLELKDKGCMYTQIQGENCTGLTSCHIDNPLEADENDIYYCCCGNSLCNQNVTFTHPTEVATYGLEVCERKGCNHSCLIVNNVASCFCDNGFALANETECVDVNECLINNGGCQEVCINTIGGYQCDCYPGNVMDSTTKTCVSDDGISCINYTCNKNNRSECYYKTVHCVNVVPQDLKHDHSQHFCTALYTFENGVFVPQLKGCLAGGINNECQRTTCSLKLSGIKDHYYCCCHGDFCNLESRIKFLSLSSVTPSVSSTNVKLVSTPTLYSSVMESVSPIATVISSNDSPTWIYTTIFGVLTGVGVVICITIIVCLVVVQCSMKKSISERRKNSSLVQHKSESPVFSMEPHLHKIIGQGRFARVYHAQLTEEVAIKIFNNTLQARESWSQEKDIYSTEHLHHPNILRFINHDQRMHEGMETYWLIFEYHPHGSLYDYLQAHTVTLKQFCTFAESAARGLAHLHSDFPHNDIMSKPAIAHRDLKSKNILVKDDLNCCISDFGLAIKFSPGEQPIEAQGQVGTSRYMAPEVLEGAISFYQESFLRIDVYAFGLILWEIASRCEILNSPIDEYYPPFDGMVSPNPSIDEMKQVVADERKRPSIPQGFLLNQDYDIVVDTINESWDPDAEARPTAHLIEARLSQFHRFIDPPTNLTNRPSKESGFLSLGTHQSVGTILPHSDSLTFNTPLPPTPTSSYSPSMTMSPTDLKPRGPNFSLGSSYPPAYPPSVSSSPHRPGFNMQDLPYPLSNSLEFSPHRSNRPTELSSLDVPYTTLPSFYSASIDDSLEHHRRQKNCTEQNLTNNSTHRVDEHLNETSL